MTKADVQKQILEPMQRVYLPPRGYDDAMLQQNLGEYADALERFGEVDLRKAWTVVRDAHQSRSWPMPGAFVAAAIRARMEREALAGGDKRRGERTPKDFWRTWEAVRRTDMAHEAAERGVAWALKCAILSGTDPKLVNLDEFVRGRASATHLAGKIEDNRPIYSSVTKQNAPLRADLRENALNMWHQIKLHEAETAQEIGFRGVPEAPQQPIDFEALAP